MKRTHGTDISDKLRVLSRTSSRPQECILLAQEVDKAAAFAVSLRFSKEAMRALNCAMARAFRLIEAEEDEDSAEIIGPGAA